MTGSNGRHKEDRILRNKVARAVFTAADSMGISDREMVERIIDQVIGRLSQSESGPTLPGLEDFVPQVKSRFVDDGTVQNLVRNILAENKTSPAAERKPVPETKTEVKVMKNAAMSIKTDGVKISTDGAKISPNAMAVLEKRYLAKDNQGKIIENVEGMFRRVARHIASAELKYNPNADVGAIEDEFYRIMAGLEFLPNTPTLMNAGQEIGQLSACFVLPVEDSMEKIFDAVKYTALIHKSGGGTGFSFSRLRPEGDIVSCTGGVASGPVSFIRAFDTATDVIKQGGKRRGANMAILNVDHPDIERFITSKADNVSLTNFNISVAVTEEFMKAVEEGRDYDLINPRGRQPVGKRNARAIFAKIVEMAWKNGDPGIIFLDRINAANPTPHLGMIESTNPCGEQPLLPNESCNLGSINLSRMTRDQDGKLAIDWEKLEKTIRIAVRFLDNVIDVNKYPLPQIEEMTKKTRKIGLGVMGFADLLIQMGIPYNSREALDTGEKLMRFVSEKATETSAELARDRGAFPAFEGSIYDRPGQPKMRNATRTTIAPTGTLSIIADCSSGIEPLFALVYVRNILDGAQFLEVNKHFEQAARNGGFYSDEMMKALADGACVKDIRNAPEQVKRQFVTAHDITPEWHVKMQAAFQKWTDNAVSKTVNFPHDATVEDVEKVYLLAYKEGCKGTTIYRDKSREKQVLSTGNGKQGQEAAAVVETKVETRVVTKVVPRKRPKVTTGSIEKVNTGCGNLYVTVAKDDQDALCEVFSTLGKTGGCATAQLESIGRLVSLALRAGVELDAIIDQLTGIRCPNIGWDSGRAVLSCPDAIGSILKKQLNNGDEASAAPAAEATKAKRPGKAPVGQCPDCGNVLMYQEGCVLCPGCGYTKC